MYFSTKGSQPKWPTVNDSYVGLLELFSTTTNAQVIKGSTQPLSEDECKKVGKSRLESVFMDGVKHFSSDKEGDGDIKI